MFTKMNPYESDLFVKWTKMVYQSAFRPPWVSIFSVITADRLRTNWIQFPFAATWGPWLQSYAVRPFLYNFYPMRVNKGSTYSNMAWLVFHWCPINILVLVVGLGLVDHLDQGDLQRMSILFLQFHGSNDPK